MVKILGALQSRDGQWRVEAVEENRGLRNGRRYVSSHYRLIHGDNLVDGLAIATVKRLLEEAGVDMADLVEAPEDAADERHGAA